VENPKSGAVYWITGLPGAGKSTLARALAETLAARGRSVVTLDGDRLRPIVGLRLGFGLADRRAMALTYARLCWEFSNQGHDVVCATVSLVEAARRWARASIPGYREIYLRASAETVAARHPKGLVAAARAGRIHNVPGVDLPIEPPDAPEVLIDDQGDRTAEQVAEEVVASLWPQADRA
jgi:adenylylsulfate kinase-like enzyme